jgi:hypothetical protein
MPSNSPPRNPSEANKRSAFSHYLPRLKREFYQADAVVFWSEFCRRVKWNNCRSRRRQSAHSSQVKDESAPTNVGGYPFRMI